MRVVPPRSALRRLAAIAAGLLGALVAAAPAAGQECRAADAAVLLSAGLVRSPLADGGHTRGVEAGIGGAYPIHRTVLSGSVSATVPRGGRVRPVAVRVRLERPLLDLFGLTACGGLLAGGSAARDGEDGAWTAAGGAVVGVARRLEVEGVAILPWIGARGLGARTAGEVLGRSVVATGVSLGVEGGVELEAERLLGAVRVTADRFDAGLGATPYPSLAIRLIGGFRL